MTNSSIAPTSTASSVGPLVFDNIGGDACYNHGLTSISYALDQLNVIESLSHQFLPCRKLASFINSSTQKIWEYAGFYCIGKEPVHILKARQVATSYNEVLVSLNSYSLQTMFRNLTPHMVDGCTTTPDYNDLKLDIKIFMPMKQRFN